MTPAFFGLSGPVLTADEHAFFADAEPVGFVLFRRNCVDRAQLRALTDSLRALTGRGDVPILIDQEGGVVARLGPPEWPAFPAGAVFADAYRVAPMTAIQAMRANGEALGIMLSQAGITVDLAPILDVARPDTTVAVASRCYGTEPMQVAALGRAMIEGLAAGGVAACIKHMPGHGRAQVDSHHALPFVNASAEELADGLRPFATLAGAAPMGMTAHIVYRAWDPDRPATLSPTVIRDVIRGAIGFDGLLMTDDIDMKALSGTAGEKAAAAIAAGCDVVLDCWARMDEMIDIAARTPPMGEATRARLARAAVPVAEPAGSLDDCLARRDALLGAAGVR